MKSNLGKHLSRLTVLTLIISTLSSASSFAGYKLPVKFKMLPPPPPGSKVLSDDYYSLHEWEKIRTKLECDRAETQTYLTSESFFGPKTKLLSVGEYAILKPLLEQLIDTAVTESKPFKDGYARVRPYNNDVSLKPCITKPKGATSYPSSHAAAGILLGMVLADLFPADQKAFLAQAKQIGINRVLGGVHHPSDVVAGQLLGYDIYDTVKSNPAFMADFAKANKALHHAE